MDLALDGSAAQRVVVAAVCAGAGAWFLARELRLGASARVFAACAVALASGANAAADATAAAALPWLFVALERVRTAPAAAARTSAAAVCVGVAALIAYTAERGLLLQAGIASFVWACCTNAGGLALPAWSCAALACGATLGVVARSSALAASASARAPLGDVDALALGVTLVSAALVFRWRALERDAAAHVPRARWLGSAGIVCALGAAFWILAQRGDAAELATLFVHGRAHVFLASATAALACAALFEAHATFTRAGTAGVLAFVFTALAADVPGVADVARALPFGGEFAPAAAAPLAALFLALVAAGALEHAASRARRTAAALFVVLVTLAVFVAPATEGPRALPMPDADDELVGWLARPAAEECANVPPLVFWQHDVLRAEPRLFVAGLDADGVQVPDAGAELELERLDAAEPAARGAPSGTRVFRALPLDARAWSANARNVRAWRVQLVLVGAQDVVLGERCAGAFLAPVHVPFASLALSALTALALVGLPRGRTGSALAWLALLVAQVALVFAD